MAQRSKRNEEQMSFDENQQDNDKEQSATRKLEHVGTREDMDG
ncbi:MAG: hypothetical protein V8S14_03500 [Lachnospiraceae bacterium]